jgi:DNA-binding response OmpR family regulator
MATVQDQCIRSVIVDDDKAIGEILKELISGEQNSVEVFGDGLDAIEFIQKQPVDIVITDLMMPRVGGLEVLRHAKAANPDVMVIIITGHASLETAIEAVREGAYEYIKKPFKLQEMEIAFNNAVEKVHLVRENRKLLQELKEAYDQLVAIKKEKKGFKEFKDKHGTLRKKIAHLNFFSSTMPSLQLVNNSSTNQRGFIGELQNLSKLKKEGLLTEKEFKALKAHLIKRLGNPTTD